MISRMIGSKLSILKWTASESITKSFRVKEKEGVTSKCNPE